MSPNGSKADAEGHIGVYLRVTNAEGTTFKVRYQFGLMYGKDQKIQYLREVSIRDSCKLNIRCGHSKFLRLGALFGAYNNYVVDGKLTIACKVS